MIFKYSKRFRFAPSFNKFWIRGNQLLKTRVFRDIKLIKMFLKCMRYFNGYFGEKEAITSFPLYASLIVGKSNLLMYLDKEFSFSIRLGKAIVSTEPVSRWKWYLVISASPTPSALEPLLNSDGFNIFSILTYSANPHGSDGDKSTMTSLPSLISYALMWCWKKYASTYKEKLRVRTLDIYISHWKT